MAHERVLPHVACEGGFVILSRRRIVISQPAGAEMIGRGADRAALFPTSVRLDDAVFAQDVALMLDAGLSLMDSLKTLSQRASGDRHALVAELLVDQLRQGNPLSEAMAATGAFGLTLMATVQSSEATGDLGASLRRYAENARRLSVLRARVASALVYPALLVAVASAVVLFLLVYVVPRFASVLEGSGRELPWMSRGLIALSRTFAALPWEVLALALFALGYAGWATHRAWRERRLDALLGAWAARIPGLRRPAKLLALDQFLRTASMLLRSGIPALKALRNGKGLLLPADRSRLEAALAAAAQGMPLADAMGEQGLIDVLGLRVLRVAQQTGDLPVALDRLADIHEHDLGRSLDRAARLIEPVLMLAIGLVIGGIVVLMYLPIFQLAAGLG